AGNLEQIVLHDEIEGHLVAPRFLADVRVWRNRGEQTSRLLDRLPSNCWDDWGAKCERYRRWRELRYRLVQSGIARPGFERRIIAGTAGARVDLNEKLPRELVRRVHGR